jgi:hypothetical protein
MAIGCVRESARGINPFSPSNHIANTLLARQLVERVFRCDAVPGSPQWRRFCETEIRLALDAAGAGAGRGA